MRTKVGTLSNQHEIDKQHRRVNTRMAGPPHKTDFAAGHLDVEEDNGSRLASDVLRSGVRPVNAIA